MSKDDRRQLVLRAARQVFSLRGFDAAKTTEIAKAAAVSEALLYQHFPSKRALYRAVMRDVIRDQDEINQRLGLRDATTAGLVTALLTYFRFVTSETTEDSEARQNFRLLLTSLAGDGSYAALIYRRAQRLNAPKIMGAVEFGRRNGEIVGTALLAQDTSMFIEHIGVMLTAILALPDVSRPYGASGEALARSAVIFCCRGLGMTEAAILKHMC